MVAKVDNPVFVRFIQQKLEANIGRKNLLTFDKSYARNSVSFRLLDYSGVSETRQMKGTHGKMVPVVAVRDQFYMYVSIGYTLIGKKDKKKLSSVSFQIFDSDRLIIRAEWNEENKNDEFHPQPHWHFHPYVEKDILTEERSESFRDTLNDGFMKQLELMENAPKVDVSDMHLTMDYNIAANPYNVEWDEDEVTKWAGKIIDSIFTELDFVISKGHKI